MARAALIALCAAGAALCQVHAPPIPASELRQSGMSNLGVVRLPDPVAAQYSGGVDQTTGFAFFGSSRNNPAVISKIELGTKLHKVILDGEPNSMPKNVRGMGKTILVDTTEDDPLRHYLYASSAGQVLKLTPGDAAHTPQVVAKLQPAWATMFGPSALDVSATDRERHFAYFLFNSRESAWKVLRVRLSDFSEQGVEPLGPDMPWAMGIDAIHRYLYVFYPKPARLCKVSLDKFPAVAGCNATYDMSGTTPGDGIARSGFDVPGFDLANLVVDSVHALAYMGTYTTVPDGQKNKVDTWPYNQSMIVRVKLGTGDRFPDHPVELLNLRAGERNLTAPVFDLARGNIYYGTDLTYPAHVYMIHVGDVAQPMREVGRLDLEPGTAPGEQLPHDGLLPPGNIAHADALGEVFLRSGVLDARHNAVYFGTDSLPGQIIKIGINGKK